MKIWKTGALRLMWLAVGLTLGGGTVFLLGAI